MAGLSPLQTPLALLGGTFDPVHRAHIAAARAVADALHCEVRLLPNAVPPHRPQPQASGAQRLALLQTACAADPRLVADDWELRQPGPSWTCRTLEHFRRQIGTERPLVLVVGADSLAQLHTWKDWQRFPDWCHLAVLPRPQAPAPQPQVEAAFPLADTLALRRRPAGLRLALPGPFLDLSSTQVREELARDGTSLAIPEAVLAHIRREHLYNVPRA